MLAVTESSHFMLLECFTVGALLLTLAVWPLIISGTKGISTALTASWKTLECLESLYKALKVLEILFHSFWSFEVLIRTEEHFQTSKKLGQIPWSQKNKIDIEEMKVRYGRPVMRKAEV